MKERFKNSIQQPERKEDEKQFILTLTPAQKMDLIRIINYYLSEPLGPEHGNRLNDLFKKLTGKDHENWDLRE